MAEPISISAYAKLHGVTEQTIRDQINAGVIKRIARGVIDREQADRSWASLRRVHVTDHDESDAGRQSARAKIAGGIAKLRLIRHRFERVQSRHLDRKEALQDMLADVEVMLAELRQLAITETAPVAAALGIDTAVAADLLAEFTDLALGELGDLAAEASAAAQAT